MIKRLFWVLCIFVVFSSKSWALDILYYANTDGSVRGIDVATRGEVAVIPSTAFKGAIVGAAREFAIDPESRMLWYTATDNAVYSLYLDTHAAGPSIPSNRLSGAIIGGERHIFIDYSRRHLLLTTTSGAIQRFNLGNLSEVSEIPESFFTDGNIGAFRHLASDGRTGNIWYAATDGSFREFNPDSLTRTGRNISFGAQYGANPGAYRHFVIDPKRDLLLYAVTDGSIATVPLSSLVRGTTILQSNVFIGANPGAGRIISYDIAIATGGDNGAASFASNYLHLPFLALDASTLSVTLRFDPEQNLFIYEYHEATSTTIDAPATFSFTTGLLIVPNVVYQGIGYHATLKQIFGTLNFTLESVGTH